MTVIANTIGGASTSTTAPLPVAATIDPANDLLAIYTSSLTATQAISRNVLLGLASQPLGLTDTQSPTNKTFDNTNAYTISTANLTLQDSSDATKQATLSISGNTTGTTRVYTFPNYNATVASLAGVETLTNKTLTSPTINTPTISNASITADTISGSSSSTTGTIYGMSVTAGLLASAAIAGQVVTASLASASVTPTKLATGAASATVATQQSTSSTSFTDLATAGPAVTVTIGSNGLALVSINCATFNGTAGDGSVMGFAVSGANTISPSIAQSIAWQNPTNITAVGSIGTSAVFLLTGLSSGSTTFTAKYQILIGGTASFQTRYIAVVPL